MGRGGKAVAVGLDWTRDIGCNLDVQRIESR
jgi:hypothetical protein